MTLFETIEQLCAVTRLQADIIQKQAEVIAQAEIADSVAAELSEMWQTAANELEQINKDFY